MIKGTLALGVKFVCAAVLAFAAMLVTPTASWAAEPTLLTTFGSYAKPSGVAVDEATGNVFVSDSGAGTVVISGPEGQAPAGVAAPYTLEGFSFCGEPSGVAVDNSPTSPSFGALYVADVCANAVKKFELDPVSEEYELSEELAASPAFAEPLGVFVDAHGDVFVADYGSSSVIEFDPSGVEINRIDTSAFFHPSSAATDAAGDLFVQGYGLSSAVYKWEANGSGEIEATTTGTEVVGSGATGVAVDSSSGLLYVTMGSRVDIYDATSATKEGEFGGSTLAASERLAVDESNAHVFVADAGNGNVAVFGPPPPPASPTILGESVSGITDTEAILEATIRPERASTSFHFEYGLDDCAISSCASVPVPDGVLETGNSAVAVKVPVAGLQPST
ncbi:MAG TPA: NHL repeat-containing protein, partial [Solirubrobacterales bacterium]